MPKASPPLEPQVPAPLTSTEIAVIKQAVRRFYGDDAVVRNFGSDPNRLELHVEASVDPGMERHECLGILMCEIVRDHISLTVTRRDSRSARGAKIAYRQGVII